MIQTPEKEVELESCSYLLSDSLPTNDSSLSDPLPAHPHLKKYKCSQIKAVHLCEQDCSGENVLRWLKERGVEQGHPEELLAMFQATQKRSISAKIGRDAVKDFAISSSLITRRLKKPPLATH